MLKSLSLGFLVAGAVIAAEILGLKVLDYFLSTFTDGFSLFIFPGGALAAAMFVRRRHPRAGLAVVFAYFAAVLIVAALVTLSIGVRLSGL